MGLIKTSCMTTQKGYDAGEKVTGQATGRKRHIVVGTMRLLMAVFGAFG